MVRASSKTLVVVVVTVFFAAAPARSQTHVVETGFLDRTISLDGQTFRYQVFVPSSYLAVQAWPVILFLHGAGERGSDGYAQTQTGLGAAIRQNPARFPAIVVFPQVPAESSWTGSIARMALAALDKTTREFSTDPARVYLTGLSMGGNGTWYIAVRNPDKFAAIAPVCGWISPFWKIDPVVADTQAPFEAVAQKLSRMPTWIFHGEIDPVVTVNESRSAYDALKAVGAPVQYTEIPGTGHNSWDPAYGSPKFWAWLFAQRRN
jgi:predicted peptidase